MKNNKRRSLFILQRKRMKRAYRKKRKGNKNRNGNKQVFNKVVRAPRNFLRTKESYRIKSNSQKQILRTHKKEDYINNHLPINLKHLVHTKESPFNIKEIRKLKLESEGIIYIPENFSIIENPEESYLTFKQIISALLIEDNARVILNYKNCKKVGLGSQVLLDIILMDFTKFVNKCQKIDRNKILYFPILIGGEEINEESVQKITFSIGSPVNLKVKEKEFSDIIRYKLCIHNSEREMSAKRRIEQKVIDTTEMADYVVDCLKRMNKELNSEKLDDLCTVIGETLINAEEHSTTKYRFSIGYFKEEKVNGNHFGVFNLVILNFGQTIYEKFKSEDCPNKDIVEKMRELSSNYTKRNFFSKKSFEEANLWTLYALQEGVTSIAYDKYRRGNGSIRFIESFFNIKGSPKIDNISKMTIISGETQITFDGKYTISNKQKPNGEKFRVMTFNESGNIEDKPDSSYVICNENYFPGTLISAKILLNDDDLKQI